MQWSSWSEFFAMGGYGIYVWGSYIVTFACVISEVLLIARRRRTLVKTYGLIHDPYTEEISNNETPLNIEKASAIKETKESPNARAVSNAEEIKNETTS
ncbi:MAG: heme exporter protein CcmD [Nitrosomonas sp.]|nr:heme exporter protein CcmD [Nitrosomonas sp.]MCW5606610.1 heme exporter protein CcmD [Nitrosomonas sp.]